MYLYFALKMSPILSLCLGGQVVRALDIHCDFLLMCGSNPTDSNTNLLCKWFLTPKNDVGSNPTPTWKTSYPLDGHSVELQFKVRKKAAFV